MNDFVILHLKHSSLSVFILMNYSGNVFPLFEIKVISLILHYFRMKLRFLNVFVMCVVMDIIINPPLGKRNDPVVISVHYTSPRAFTYLLKPHSHGCITTKWFSSQTMRESWNMVRCALGKVFRGVKWLRICFSDKWLFVFILRGHVKVAGMNKRLEGNKVNEKKGGFEYVTSKRGG